MEEDNASDNEDGKGLFAKDKEWKSNF